MDRGARLRFDVERAREAVSDPGIAAKASADRKPHARRPGRPRRQALAAVKLIEGRVGRGEMRACDAVVDGARFVNPFSSLPPSSLNWSRPACQRPGLL
jgi:hypothetical protein